MGSAGIEVLSNVINLLSVLVYCSTNNNSFEENKFFCLFLARSIFYDLQNCRVYEAVFISWLAGWLVESFQLAIFIQTFTAEVCMLPVSERVRGYDCVCVWVLLYMCSSVGLLIATQTTTEMTN